jgi:hypothetical protein
MVLLKQPTIEKLLAMWLYAMAEGVSNGRIAIHAESTGQR